MTKITDIQIAMEAERSPQVISAMKKSRPKQYSLLKLATYCLQNGIMDTKKYNEMDIDELTAAQEKLIEQMQNTIGDLEIVNDFISEYNK